MMIFLRRHGHLACRGEITIWRCIRIGTGGGLKSLWPQGRVGSNPTTATNE